MKRVFGLHLLIDGYVRDPAVLAPEPLIQLFDTLVEELKMKYLMPPVATRVRLEPEKLHTDEDEGGWSVICQITTSHIAIHCWPLRGAFMLDIFSCKAFDPHKAADLVLMNLGVVSHSTKIIERLA